MKIFTNRTQGFWGGIACLALLALILGWGIPAGPAPAQAQGPGGLRPVVGAEIRGVSLDVDLRTLPQTAPAKSLRSWTLGRDPKETANGQNLATADAARERVASPNTMPSPSLTFLGLDFNTWGNGYPPDTNGDVGPNHYIETVNTSIGIFAKTGGAPIAAFRFNTFFAAATAPCNTSNNGDPVVLYDGQANRWIITDFAWTDFHNGPYYECIAVSKTGDPVSGGWWLFTMRADDPAHPWLNDYPKLGVWPDGIYMSANMFDIFPVETFQGVRVWALDRQGLYSNPAVLREIHFDTTAGSSLLPSNLRGIPPPFGSPNYFVARDAVTNANLGVWKFHVDWSDPLASTFTGPTSIAVTPWAVAGQVPESSGNMLDSLSARLMMQNQYRNINGVESLWLNHTVSSGGFAAVRWYELRVTNGAVTLAQQSTFQPNLNSRWMGSLAVDGKGNMAVGYSLSSASLFPSLYIAGRLVSDPVNTLGQGEALFFAGAGAQTNNCGGNPCTRWGDYTAMTIDPNDDCTFWYTNEYYATSGGNWQTRIGSFKYPSCVPHPSNLFQLLPVIAR